MNIIFIGCVEFSEHCLKHVLKHNGKIVGVVTSRDNGLNSDYADLSGIAGEENIPVHYSDDINDKATVLWIKSLSPDIIFCFGWSQLIKHELLSFPPMGVLGSHPSQLPKNRGRHPIIWALVLGLKETGLTFFFMDEMADSGPILAQKKITINTDDTARSLYDKIENAASGLIKEFLPKLADKSYKSVKQNPEEANRWRKRTYVDGIIDWRMSATAISNMVRALTRPYPGAEFIYKDEVVKVWSVTIVDAEKNTGIEPGKIIEVRNGIPIIKCQDDALMLLDYDSGIEMCIGKYL